jgi:uncharacterized protein YecE (DUF72 family)
VSTNNVPRNGSGNGHTTRADENVTRLRIGTCGYSYPGAPPSGWWGVFYPKGEKKRRDELEFYSTFFNTVEINSTFYRPATPSMARAWATKTPSDFEFAVKVWQKFTHPTKLGEGAGESRERWERFNSSDVELFVQGIAPLTESGKLGVLLFQYPASFHCETENLERVEKTLAAFERFPKVVELRHRSWSDRRNETNELLDRSRAAWAYIDEPKFVSSVKQEMEARSDSVYIRLHGRNYQTWWKHRESWERYDYLYQPDEIQKLAGALKQLAAKSPAAKFYVQFNNHARGQAVANSFMLKAELEPTLGVKAPKALIEAFPVLKDFVTSGDSGQLELS